MSTEGKSRQLNFNTVLLLLIGAVMGLLVHKADSANTKLIELGVKQEVVAQQVAELRQQVKDMVPKRDFDAELGRLRREMEDMRTSRMDGGTQHKPL